MKIDIHNANLHFFNPSIGHIFLNPQWLTCFICVVCCKLKEMIKLDWKCHPKNLTCTSIHVILIIKLVPINLLQSAGKKRKYQIKEKGKRKKEKEKRALRIEESPNHTWWWGYQQALFFRRNLGDQGNSPYFT